MDQKQVLLVGFGAEYEQLAAALAPLETRRVGGEMLERTVGQVCSEPLQAGAGKPLDLPLILFHNLTRDELDEVLKAIRQVKLPRQPLKAMVTPTNQGWTLAALYEELQQEQQVMGALIRLKQLRDRMPMPDIMNIPAMQARMRAEMLLSGGQEATVEAIDAAYQELQKWEKAQQPEGKG